MTKQEQIRLSDKELARVQAYADEHGLTLDEAATQLSQDAIASKFRKNLGRGPARVYDMKRTTA
jgi:hypothetical protein